MKRYVKPELFFEQYELSQHVANCAFEPVGNGSYIGDEELGLDVYIIINESTEACVVKDSEIYCYTNGRDGMNIFNS